MLRTAQQGEFAQGAIDVAGSDREHGMAGPDLGKQTLDAFLQRGAINDVLVAGSANSFRQCRRGDAANRHFTGGVDIGLHPEILLTETASEIVPEAQTARKSMWLEQHQPSCD